MNSSSIMSPNPGPEYLFDMLHDSSMSLSAPLSCAGRNHDGNHGELVPSVCARKSDEWNEEEAEEEDEDWDDEDYSDEDEFDDPDEFEYEEEDDEDDYWDDDEDIDLEEDDEDF